MISASMKVVLTCLLLVYTALIITLSVKLTVVLMNTSRKNIGNEKNGVGMAK